MDDSLMNATYVPPDDMIALEGSIEKNNDNIRYNAVIKMSGFETEAQASNMVDVIADILINGLRERKIAVGEPGH